MASSAGKHSSSIRECGGVLSRLVYLRAERQGVDVGPLLVQTGLSRAIIDDQNARVGVANQIKFVGLVADALGEKNLGFYLACQHDIRQIGLLYYVAASADTLSNALRRAERYVGLQNESVRFKVSKGRSIRVEIEYAGVARHTDVQQIEFIIASITRLCRQLTERNLSPTHVRLRHKLGEDKSSLERLLDCTIADGADADEIEFPAASWDLPLISADPYLHRLCVQRCEEALAGREKDVSSLKVEVENAIAALLPHGQARHDLVAAQLGMSPRTLARRLSSESSSFAAISEEVRSALAERYLADRALPISEIAWLLGYAEIGTFTRAYQRWTGMLPSAARAQWRRRAGGGAN
jgi:AraC-like DNA-binding protein